MREELEEQWWQEHRGGNSAWQNPQGADKLSRALYVSLHMMNPLRWRSYRQNQRGRNETESPAGQNMKDTTTCESSELGEDEKVEQSTTTSQKGALQQALLCLVLSESACALPHSGPEYSSVYEGSPSGLRTLSLDSLPSATRAIPSSNRQIVGCNSVGSRTSASRTNVRYTPARLVSSPGLGGLSPSVRSSVLASTCF